MNIKSIKHTKLNKILYKKLSLINCIKNLKYIKILNNSHNITYNNINYIKILNKPSKYLKVNYKELLKIKKKLKSGYLVLSTPFGIITDKKSIMYKTGGVILGYIKY